MDRGRSPTPRSAAASTSDGAGRPRRWPSVVTATPIDRAVANARTALRGVSVDAAHHVRCRRSSRTAIVADRRPRSRIEPIEAASVTASKDSTSRSCAGDAGRVGRSPTEPSARPSSCAVRPARRTRRAHARRSRSRSIEPAVTTDEATAAEGHGGAHRRRHHAGRRYEEGFPIDTQRAAPVDHASRRPPRAATRPIVDTLADPDAPRRPGVEDRQEGRSTRPSRPAAARSPASSPARTATRSTSKATAQADRGAPRRPGDAAPATTQIRPALR